MKSYKISRLTCERMASKIRPCLLKLCYWMYIYVHVSKFNWAVWLWLAVSPSKADLVKNCGPIGVAFHFHLTRGAAFSWFCRLISIGEWKLCWSVPLSIFLMENFPSAKLLASAVFPTFFAGQVGYTATYSMYYLIYTIMCILFFSWSHENSLKGSFSAYYHRHTICLP